MGCWHVRNGGSSAGVIGGLVPIWNKSLRTSGTFLRQKSHVASHLSIVIHPSCHGSRGNMLSSGVFVGGDLIHLLPVQPPSLTICIPYDVLVAGGTRAACKPWCLPCRFLALCGWFHERARGRGANPRDECLGDSTGQQSSQLFR